MRRPAAHGTGLPSAAGLVAFALLVLLCLSGMAWANSPKILSARIGPALDYTRLTVETDAAVNHTLATVRNPERLVIDLEGVESAAQIEALAARLDPNDPYIRAVRIGRFRPGMVRVVLDLKTEVRPQAFRMTPAGEFNHRLVVDLYAAAAAPSPAGSDRRDARVAAIDASASGTVSVETAAARTTAPPAEPAPAVEPRATAAPAPAPKQSPKGRDVARLITIAIDAGHGGEDPGAKGRHGTWEKNVTLSIAQKLKALVDEEPGMRAVLTRDGDYFVSLGARVDKARRVNADLFVSVHADAFIKPHARGSSVFALSERGATSAAARWLAKKENEADLIGGVNLDVADPYLKQTLLDLSQTATINDSLKLGKAVLGELGGINTLHKPAVEQAGFAVLKAPDIPSILVETAFISNPDEERRLRDDAYQDKMARAILAGIKRYFAKNPPLARTTRVAQADAR